MVQSIFGATELLDIDYWRSRFPDQRIDDSLGVAEGTPPAVPQLMKGDLARDGVCRMERAAGEDLRMRLLLDLRRAGHIFGHPIYAVALEAFWFAAFRLGESARFAMGNDVSVTTLPAIVTVPPKHAGVGPHRDSQLRAFKDDGAPTRLSVWLALTAAEVDRACLHYLPMWADPNVPDDLSSVQVPDLRLIRAVPMAAGDALMFNQAVLHWGGYNATRHTRVGVVWEFADSVNCTDDEAAVALESDISFAKRLGFMARAIMRLSQRDTALAEPRHLDVAREIYLNLRDSG